MHIPFKKLSDEAHIWIYQGDRALSKEETPLILREVIPFLAQWAPHGKELQCAADILYNRFLVLGVEKGTRPLSCCTIDTSIQLMRDLQTQFKVNFLDKTTVIFKKETLFIEVPMDQMKQAVQQEKITPDMWVFDSTITRKKDLQDQFLLPVKDAWVRKYLYFS